MSIRTTVQILIQSLRITVKFDLNPWFTLNYKRVRIKTSNYSHFELDPGQIYFELVLLQINRLRINC